MGRQACHLRVLYKLPPTISAKQTPERRYLRRGVAMRGSGGRVKSTMKWSPSN